MLAGLKGRLLVALVGIRDLVDENGKAAGEIEGGGLRVIAVSAEDHDGSMEGSSGEDPPQGLRELDQHYSPRRSRRRNLLVCSVLQRTREARAQVLSMEIS
ncbi:hypothetical protein ISN45_Aa06g004650 [Arabidopsis thaliana x Arabidopsis arenosa]|uniref:Uncharacterized protein n=1 Tax=Arabidopsis thaliana x Arabidopsis arenosa TaxID=1240361 RepID=A0A8T1YTU0_9BRAS|nr:hypothetical protein ISN45_Aa06g004650 [Arabidopsis thaliana x Arabidopsis arenosa]